MNDQEINMPADSINQEEQVGNVVQSPGAQLAAAREAHGWSVEQVANQLNLASRQILAIERDDYAALPGTPIARGFVRAYAKLLRIDAVPLLAGIPSEAAITNVGIASPKAMSRPFADTHLPLMTNRSTKSPKRLSGLIGLALILAGLWWAQQQGLLRGASDFISAAIAAKNKDVDVVADTAGASAHSAPVIGIEANTAEPASLDASQGATTTEAEGGGVAQVLKLGGPQSSTTAATEISTPAAPSVVEHDALVLKAHGDTWVEIKRPDNTIVFSAIVKAGKTESIDLNGPVSLIIGNSAGVEATYRGAPLELKANTNSNVARVNLK